MKKYGKHQSERNSRLKTHRIVLLGAALLLAVTLLAGSLEFRATQTLMQSTMQTLRQQCVSFNKLVTADCTKSLFRLSDSLLEVSRHIESDPSLAADDYLEACVDELRVSGIALLDENLELVASSYTRPYHGGTWEDSLPLVRFADIVQHPAKVFLDRIHGKNAAYDVCAVARRDKSGILIGFYIQPTGLLTDTENDLATLLNGLQLVRSGNFVIAKDGSILASSDLSIRGQSAADIEILTALASCPQREQLTLVACGGSFYLGGRSASSDNALYVYFPLLSAFSTTLTVSLAFAMLYVAFLLILISYRNHALSDSQRALRETNLHLQRTVNMLYSLENIYFTIFYVNLVKNSYKSVFLAPWLQATVPESGVYTQLKEMFVRNMVLDSYQAEIDEKMAPEYIRNALSREKLSDVRKSFYLDYQAMRGNTVTWCRVTVTVVDFDDSGKPLHVLAVLQDVNEEKAREAHYQAQIVEEAQEARRANIAKSEFLRRISHDIRTPINGIQGYISMANRFPNDLEKQAMYRKKATQALESLLELVNNVLDMSKLESREIQLEEKPFDLIKLLGEIESVIQPQAAERAIRYTESCELGEHDAAAHLIGSPMHLRQILLNLTSNAVKYGKPGGYIRLTCVMLSRQAGRVVFQFVCEDNGIGMREEFQSHMFEPFTQEAANARTSYQGTGLGLSIVKKLVDTMGGNITFTSKKDVGTTFRVTLPFQIDSEWSNGAAGAQTENAVSFDGINILLVEDNALNMEIAEFLLQEHGAAVTQAWNGREALDRFAASNPGHFDLILMDIMMPLMNGMEAARAIRALDRPDAKTVPIIAMSANAFSDDIQQSMDAGMNAHLPKPIDEATLLTTVTRFASGSRAANNAH